MLSRACAAAWVEAGRDPGGGGLRGVDSVVWTLGLDSGVKEGWSVRLYLRWYVPYEGQEDISGAELRETVI